MSNREQNVKKKNIKALKRKKKNQWFLDKISKVHNTI